jgi:chromosome segregation ATPase
MGAMKLSALMVLVAMQPSQAAQMQEGATLKSMGNPIRKVVTMLQQIKKKVEAEGEAEEEMFKKFMCYCKNSGGDLQKGIDANEAKIPEVQSSIEEAEAQKAQLGEDLVKHKADREAAKGAMAEANGIRAKEAATFAAFKAESDANIEAVGKAVASLEKGAAGGAAFLQTAASDTLKKLVQAKDNMIDADREEVLSFLGASNSEDYAPQSGEITGILKELGDQMNADLDEATKNENAAIKSFNGLTAAKTKEVDANTAAIEEKTVRQGEVSVDIVNMKNDLSDAQKSLAEDQKFLADMEKNCATKTAEWDVIVKTRAEELLALDDTIKMLNDDDALELFKKTLPSASSFMQIQVTSKSMQARALAMIKAAHSKQLNFIALALHGKKVGFDKVVAMIDDMIGVLGKEQTGDDKKKQYCETKFDELDDKKKVLEREVADTEKAMAEAKDAIETLTSEIEALDAGIKALDQSVAEATEQRKNENEEFSNLMTQNTAAKELIGMAKNRLNKFYNPKMYKAPPKRELSEQDRIAVNMGGTAPPTPAPGGIAGTGISALVQTVTAPPAAPGAPGAFKKKGEESNGVIGMMDLLAADLDKEMTVGKQEEKDAQADYEQMLSDSAEKRAQDMKSLSDKGAANADAQAALQGHKEDNHDASGELKATLGVIAATHGECDFLLQHFDMRKEARNGEIDSLKKAKAVLSGADYSLLQVSHVSHLRGRN